MPGSLASNPASQIPADRGFWPMVSAWLPVLFCMAVIAAESQPMFGADHTSGPLRHMFESLFGPISEDHWDIFHFLIRKSGHFIGYGLLSLAWLRAFRLTFRFPGYPFRSWIQPHGLAMVGTLLVASSDEIHQTFLPNRTGTFHDVVTDCCGGLLLQAIVLFSIRSRAKRRANL